ncbi:hypothetical protein Q7A53_06505 [Halobacillus rhizosphaerae]|uniref:hypothetical protein n=1 Tax=Halobacillus rhizosphaerae TaxID=3064889 RepID=UPI00398AA93E
MAEIKLTFTEEQYKKLVETIFLGSWMLNSTRLEDLDEEAEEIRELVLSRYKEANLEDKVVYQEEMEIHDLTIDYESELLDQYIEEYDEFSFWDKLVEKLTEKEMVQTFGADVVSAPLTDEMLKTQLELEEKIGQELEEKGITNLHLPLDKK